MYTEINKNYTLCHIFVFILVFYLRLFAKHCIDKQKAVLLSAELVK